jgi:RNA exonuclease 1
MIHPYVIDTSVAFNMSGVRNRKSKLSALVDHFLKERIQQGNNGHCPIEDAGACMKLIKLKLAKGKDKE